MNKNITRSLLAMGLAMVAITGMAENRLYIDNFSIKPGETKEVNFNLQTEQGTINCQFELILPEGLVCADEYGEPWFEINQDRSPMVGRRKVPHTVSFNQTVCKDGVTPCIRVVIKHDQNLEFAELDGCIVTTWVTANENYVETSPIEMRDVVCGHTSSEKLIDYATYFGKAYVKVPLSEVAAYDGKEIGLDGDLGVAVISGDKAFVTDGNDNWMQVRLGEKAEEMQAITTVEDGTIMGTFSGEVNPYMSMAEEPLQAENEVTVNIKDYDLGTDLFAPKANEVLNVVGFYQEGGKLSGFSAGNGQAVTLNNDWCAGDVPALNVASQYKFENTVAQLKSPWENGAAGAPARASSTDADAANNVELYPLVYPSPETTTAVADINAAKAVVSVKYYNAAGQAADNAFEGVNMMVVKYADGTQSVSKVVK